ncbi:MAG: pyrrolo-quinoline quinone [Terriglobales bacterium]
MLLRSFRVLALSMAAALLSSALSSCGGGDYSGSSTPPPPPTSSVTVTLSPSLSAVTTSHPQTLTATLTGGTGTLLWFVDSVQNGNASVGQVTSAGDGTASYLPSASTKPGIHLVTAKVSGGALSSSVSIAVTDLKGVFTHHNDNARTGQNTQEYALTPATVSPATFGKLFSCALDGPGYVYAEPLYVANLTMSDGKMHNVVFLATESDWVYAYDADSNLCQQLWKKNLLGPAETTVPAGDTDETNDLTPEIGITSTPVIDIQSGIIYVCAKSKSTSGYFHRLHALTLASGANAISPVEITATNFLPLPHLQRPALLLNGNTVYVAFGSHGDHNTYQGWLMGYDPATLSQKFVWSTTDPTSGNNKGAIWQSGGGPAADDSGNVYLETANGEFDADSGGNNYSDSVVKLNANGSVLDYFTPSNESALSLADVDLGSSGLILLPDSVGSGVHPHLLVASGKPGLLFLLDRNNLGKFNSSIDQAVQEVGVQANSMNVLAGIFGPPAYWNGNLYTAAIADYLKQFTVTGGAISTAPQSHSSGIYNRRGGAPAISANGITGGVVWVLDISAYPGGPAVLNAYDATNVGTQLYSSPTTGSGAAGNAVKFTVPTVANGRVYVGTQGQFDVFGLLGN